jgi:hypothetical protein
MATPDEAVEFLRLVVEAESNNRAEALDDLKFRFGDQWPTQMQNTRELQDRPWFTINETDSYVRAVVNQIRQQRPRIKAQPVDSRADPKVAQVITGLNRHVEENSDAFNAYDLASEFAITMGWGYWRLRTDYIREDSFFQDIYVDPVENPFTVYFDPNSSLPDGSDAERALITDQMPKREFLKQHPGAMLGGFTARGSGDSTAEWISVHDIRIAEMFKVERKRARLVMLSDGTPVYEDDLPPKTLLDKAGITVVQTRDSWKRKVMWSKVTAFETLEEKEIPGRFIPIVPVYGVSIIVDGKRRRFGMVRFAKDPQRMVNFWQTSITESVALAPKAKWMGPAGFDEGFEQEWRQANNSALPTLHYNEKDENGNPIAPPQRLQPEPPPEGAMMAALAASQNLQRVLGMFDPAVRGGAQRKSDKTLNAEQQQTDIANYHFYDNLTRSLKHTGRIILDWTPVIWDTQRVQRIIGEDGRPKLVTLNQKQLDPTTGAIEKVLNDVTVGTFDVVMETGPGYNSRRQEAVSNLLQLLPTPLGEKIAQVADDIIVRMMDFPGSDVVADRLAAANPLSQVDEESEIPPQAQMMILTLKKNLDQSMEALKAAGMEIKFKTGIEQMKQSEETKRELIRQTTKAHDIETLAATKRHDTETMAVTKQNVAEIDGLVKLLLAHVDTRHLQMEIAQRDAEQQGKAAEDAALPQPAETQGA